MIGQQACGSKRGLHTDSPRQGWKVKNRNAQVTPRPVKPESLSRTPGPGFESFPVDPNVQAGMSERKASKDRRNPEEGCWLQPGRPSKASVRAPRKADQDSSSRSVLSHR